MFDLNYCLEIMSEAFWVYVVSSILYPIFVRISMWVKIEKNDIFDKMYLYWNAFLAMFSIWGVYQVVPTTIRHLQTHGIVNAICGTELGNILAFPVLLFALSKIIEFGDTVFVVIRGRRLIFLQYYHHWVTMLYCWYAYVNTSKHNNTCVSFAQ
jgi:elongation of very long chain fatty acids protein 6